jgi:hypothetical protein
MIFHVWSEETETSLIAFKDRATWLSGKEYHAGKQTG